jgi:hypothetical protein
MGTPKTIIDAMLNGVLLSQEKSGGQLNFPASMLFEMDRHVKDFLAQRIGSALLSVNSEEATREIKELAKYLGIVIRD